MSDAANPTEPNAAIGCIKALFRIETALVCVAAALFYINHNYAPTRAAQLAPSQAYQYRLSMSFDAADEVAVATFLPQSNERQRVLQESSVAQAMHKNTNVDTNGLLARWTGNEQANAIYYSALIQADAFQFSLSPELEINTPEGEEWQAYLTATDLVQANHKDIAELWQIIAPADNSNLVASLRAIYDYTASLEPLPFKGTTDAITALRLSAASCNGKSRLFVALARHCGIPSRLVGGVILNNGSKKTSHQWVEINVQGQWVPFDPTNGYFASIPANYLELYRGDHAMFTHSANIDFDYRYSIDGTTIATALFPTEEESQGVHLGVWLKRLHMAPQLAAIFLAMPFCAMVIILLRNVFGLKSFGIFMPMLVGASCAFTGLGLGLLGMAVIVMIAFAALWVLNRLRLLKIPKLALTIVLVNTAIISLMAAFGQLNGDSAAMLSLFPVIVISFVADKIHDLVEQADYKALVETVLGSAVGIALCYGAITSASLVGLLALYPEIYVLMVAAQLYLGRWTGLRISEILRFRRIKQGAQEVIGINHRNRELVAKLNSATDLITAADKLVSKQKLQALGIPVPTTLAQFDSLVEVDQLVPRVAEQANFVIKPNAGSQGNGILVIKRREGEDFIGPGNRRYSIAQLQALLRNIISGNYSQLGDSDTAYIEQLVQQHTAIQSIAPYGLSDIRVVVVKGKVVSAMLRIPTTQSDGKANLHQGALGAAVNLQTGVVFRCLQQGVAIHEHPDSGEAIIGLQVPHWAEILDICRRCTQAIPLGYMGVDICLDAERGPLVLEVNGRPGLEIQNVNNSGLLVGA